MRSNDRDLHKLAESKVAYLDDDQPFESPAKSVTPGPYYKNIEEVLPDLGERTEANADNEKSLSIDRRDFMRLFSAGAMAATTAACVRRPVEKAVPFVNQPIDTVPGVATYFASTVDGAGVIVKTREGRPVFVEGNPEHPLSQGTASKLAMSELQALFHPDRRKAPEIRYGVNRVDAADWDEVYDRLATRLQGSKNIAILAKSTTGHTVSFYKEVLEKLGMPASNLYLYESNSLKVNMETAYRLAFGIEGTPRSDLRKTDFLLGVGSEFLDLGAANIYESKSWAANYSFRFGRKGRMVQFESRMTNTGAAANQRHVIAPGDELAVLLMICEALLANSAAKGSEADKAKIQAVLESQQALIQEAKARLGFSEDMLSKLAQDLLTSKSIVMAGESMANSAQGSLVQLAGIMANILAGAFASGNLHYDRGWMLPSSGEDDIKRFLNDADSIDFLFVIDVNPAFTLPASTGIKDKLAAITSVASIQSMPCETDELAEFRLNGHNILERWGDEQFVAGFWSLVQPTVRPFSNSRQAEEILLWTMAKLEKPLGYQSYQDYIRKNWQEIYKSSGIRHDFETFFQAILRKGFYGKIEQRSVPALADLSASFQAKSEVPRQGLRLLAHLDPRLIDGVGADRPVLQEAGDNLTTIAWDSWLAISPKTAMAKGFRYNDVIKVEGPGGSLELALYPMPGLHDDTVAIARGNGHWRGISRVTTDVGVDPLNLLGFEQDPLSGLPVTAGQSVSLVATGRKYRLAAQQKHNDVGNRADIVKTVEFAKAAKNVRKEIDLDEVPDLFPKLAEHPKYRWGMSIDLDKCSGCGACTVACDLENNVPQVGREQIILGREMHWIRVDRYFSGAAENPQVSYQPVGCQHCNHAPCEAVCPVYATVHDEMGMNNQVYNRCVGTRYCANACPYKVRRFNWFTHKWNVMGDRPVDRNPRALNPDVTIRTRGVMEKCTFCVQRIQAGRHEANLQDRDVRDGEIRTACESACPTNAIVFGNLKDKTSRVARLRRDSRSYLMLGGDPEHGHYGLKTLPNVSYLAEVYFGDEDAAETGMPHSDAGGHDGHDH